jgi:hypothetical protein
MSTPERSTGLSLAIARWLERPLADILFERDIEDPAVIACHIECANYSTTGRGPTPYDAAIDAATKAKGDGIDW